MDLFTAQSIGPWLVAIGLIVLLWGIMLLLIMRKKTGPVTPAAEPLPPGYEPPAPPKQPSNAIYYWIGVIVTLLILLGAFFFNQSIQKWVFGGSNQAAEFNTEIDIPEGMQENARTFDTTLARINAAEDKGSITKDTALLYKLYYANDVTEKIPAELRGVDDEKADLDGAEVYIEIDRKKDEIDPEIMKLMEYYLLAPFEREGMETTESETSSFHFIPEAQAQTPTPTACDQQFYVDYQPLTSENFLLHYKVWGEQILDDLGITIVSTGCASTEQEAENDAATAYAASVYSGLTNGWNFLTGQGLRAPKLTEEYARIDVDVSDHDNEITAVVKERFEGSGVPTPPETASVKLYISDSIEAAAVAGAMVRGVAVASQYAYNVDLCDETTSSWSCKGTAAYYQGEYVQHAYTDTALKQLVDEYLTSGQKSLFARSSSAYLWWLYLSQKHGNNFIKNYYESFLANTASTPTKNLENLLIAKSSNLSHEFVDEFYLWNLHSGTPVVPGYTNASSYIQSDVYTFAAGGSMPKLHRASSVPTGAVEGFGYTPLVIKVSDIFAATGSPADQAFIPEAHAQDTTSDENALRVDVSGAYGLIAKVVKKVGGQQEIRALNIDNAGNASFYVKESENIDDLTLTLINPDVLTGEDAATPTHQGFVVSAQVNTLSEIPDDIQPLPEGDTGTSLPINGDGNGDDGGGFDTGDPAGGGLDTGDPAGGSSNIVVPGGVPSNISNVIQIATSYVFGFAGSLAVLFIVIGGFRYVISSGNPEMVASAKKTIQYAVIGLTISILALVIVQSVLNAITGS
ncbi:pilin [Patescibacteria group bacterium]